MEVCLSKWIALTRMALQQVNFLQLAQEYDRKLDDNFTEWVERYREGTDLNGTLTFVSKFSVHNVNLLQRSCMCPPHDLASLVS